MVDVRLSSVSAAAGSVCGVGFLSRSHSVGHIRTRRDESDVAVWHDDDGDAHHAGLLTTLEGYTQCICCSSQLLHYFRSPMRWERQPKMVRRIPDCIDWYSYVTSTCPSLLGVCVLRHPGEGLPVRHVGHQSSRVDFVCTVGYIGGYFGGGGGLIIEGADVDLGGICMGRVCGGSDRDRSSPSGSYRRRHDCKQYRCRRAVANTF